MLDEQPRRSDGLRQPPRSEGPAGRRRRSTAGRYSIARLVQLVTASSLLRNSSLIMSTTLLTAGFGALYWVVASRAYPAHDVGLATGIIAAQAFTAMVACLGTDALLLQKLPLAASDRAWRALVSTVLAFGALAALAGGVIVALVLPLIAPHFALLRQPVIFGLLVGGACLTTTGTLTDAVFIASRRSEHMVLRNLVTAGVKLAVMLGAVVVIAHPGVTSILVSWVGAALVSVVAAQVIQLPRLRPGYHFSTRGGWTELLEARRDVAAHFLTNTGSQAPQWLLPVIVVSLVAPSTNAYFYVTWSASGIFLLISPAVSASLFAEGVNVGDLMGNVRRSVRFLAVLLPPIILVCALFGRRLLGLFGPGYAEHGAVLLTLLALSAVPDAVTNIYVSVERVQGRYHRAAALNVSMAAVALVLTVVLVPSMGATGPGVAWLSAQTAGALVGLVLLLRVRASRRGNPAVILDAAGPGGRDPGTDRAATPVAATAAAPAAATITAAPAPGPGLDEIRVSAAPVPSRSSHSAAAQIDAVTPVDEETVLVALGEETAAVLRAIREERRRGLAEVEDLIGHARRRADDLVAGARASAEEMRAAAEEEFSRTTARARAEAADLLQRADAEASTIRQRARDDGLVIVDEGRRERLRAEAELARLERLCAARERDLEVTRDRLTSALGLLRRTVDQLAAGMAETDGDRATDPEGVPDAPSSPWIPGSDEGTDADRPEPRVAASP